MMKSIQKNENTVYFSWKRNAVKTRWVYILTIKKVLISIYCSRGMNLSAVNFKVTDYVHAYSVG